MMAISPLLHKSQAEGSVKGYILPLVFAGGSSHCHPRVDVGKI